MARKSSASPLARNLRQALNQVRSVSQFCREVGINRQQMNKYLTGLSRPSPFNLERIARHLGLKSSDFALSSAEFNRLIDSRGGFAAAREILLPAALRTSFVNSDPRLSRYLGYYKCYAVSGSWPGHVLCYTRHIFRNGPWFQSRTVGRFRDPETKALYVMKSHGVLTMQADAIFLMEQEVMGVPNLSATVLEQSYRTSGLLLRGKTVYMPFHVPRRSIAVQSVFAHVGQTADLRELIGQSALLDPASTRIDPRIRKMLEEPLGVW